MAQGGGAGAGSDIRRPDEPAQGQQWPSASDMITMARGGAPGVVSTPVPGNDAPGAGVAEPPSTEQRVAALEKSHAAHQAKLDDHEQRVQRVEPIAAFVPQHAERLDAAEKSIAALQPLPQQLADLGKQLADAQAQTAQALDTHNHNFLAALDALSQKFDAFKADIEAKFAEYQRSQPSPHAPAGRGW